MCFSTNKQTNQKIKKKREKLHAQNKIKKAKVYTFRSRRRRGKVSSPREEEEAEEIGLREGERERKLILGARGTLKTQRFRLGFLLFILFLFPLLAVSRPCPIVLYAYDTGTAGKLPCPCFNRREGGSSNTNIT